MVIGVTGYKGRLGSELVRRGCVPLKADVASFEQLNAALLDVRPDVVVHCAAMTDVDRCEREPMRAMRVNVGGTYQLCQRYHGPVVYLSTDYIFDGRLGPYNELQQPCPINIYGWTKLGGEMVLKARDNPADLIVRTTILYGYRSLNFVIKVLTALRLSLRVPVPRDLRGSPTYIPHLAEAIMMAIKEGVSGTVNVVGMNVLSRYEFGRLIARQWDLDPDLVVPGPINGGVPRPTRVGLKVDRAIKLGLPIYTVNQGLEEMQRAMETVATG